MAFLSDEQGKPSLSRTLLLFQLIYVDVTATVSALWGVRPEPEWWGYNGALAIALVAWAAGPRGLQYLGPVVGQMVDKLTGRAARTDNRRTDDERG